MAREPDIAFLLPWHDAGAQCTKADMGILKSADPNRARGRSQPLRGRSVDAKEALGPRREAAGAPETEHILRLAMRYEVSKEACRRYTDPQLELTSECYAR
jgi:hypothetical protein